MISFLLCLAILIVGYFVYGKIVDNTFGPDDRETPAVRINDGVDYVVMPQWKLFLVQLLNIAGLGPIFGAMQGALWGPVVFLWITFGTIFAGGVHDYFSGMMSERNDGASIAEITGKYLGPVMQNVMRVFSVVLLIMVGTVFAVGPAGLIVELCSQSGASGVLTSLLFWLIIILVYYFIATFISIDAVIGKIYPIFGICLGHQLLALANGADTEKLKYGHRGANQPVKDLLTGRDYITSQNHGYAVKNDSLPDHAVLRFMNLNDGTCEGVSYQDFPGFSVQFHPEACGGPHDSEFLFREFVALMERRA